MSHTFMEFAMEGSGMTFFKSYRFTGAHSKEVCHHGAEPWRKTGLCDEAELELCETDDVVALLPVPAGDVEQVGLVVVLHQLDDHPDVVAVVLDRDHPHDVGRVLRVRVLAVLVRQHQARVGLMNLKRLIRGKQQQVQV